MLERCYCCSILHYINFLMLCNFGQALSTVCHTKAANNQYIQWSIYSFKLEAHRLYMIQELCLLYHNHFTDNFHVRCNCKLKQLLQLCSLAQGLSTVQYCCFKNQYSMKNNSSQLESQQIWGLHLLFCNITWTVWHIHKKDVASYGGVQLQQLSQNSLI